MQDLHGVVQSKSRLVGTTVELRVRQVCDDMSSRCGTLSGAQNKIHTWRKYVC